MFWTQQNNYLHIAEHIVEFNDYNTVFKEKKKSKY